MTELSVTDRENVLNEIIFEMRNVLGDNLISAITYGSTLCEDFADTSDFDVLVVLKEVTMSDLLLLKNLKLSFKKRGLTVDLNIHSLSETPEYRKYAFWHNNRSLYMRMELQLYGKILLGENLFPFFDIKKEDLKLEAVRVINSLLYQARKLLINRELIAEERVRMMKFCIYAVLYALAAYEIYPKTKVEAMKTFKEMFPELPDPQGFLDSKVHNASDISDTEIQHAYEFLVRIDQLIFQHLSQ